MTHSQSTSSPSRPLIARCLGLLAAALLLPLASGANDGDTIDLQSDWWQWGGPSRDFVVRAPELASSWSRAAPRETFRRELQGGHSTVGLAAGVVVVHHGSRGTERVTASSLSGDTLWEQQYAVAYRPGMPAYDGPHAAPLFFEDLVITVAIDASIRAWQRSDGTLRWQRDLRSELGVTLPQAGYAASPLLIDDALLLPGLGRATTGLQREAAPGMGVFKLDARTGETVWRRESFPSSHASPIAFSIDGREIAVFHGMEELIAMTPERGELLWRFGLRRGAADNVSFTPQWDPSSRSLLLSHAYDDRGAQRIVLDERGDSPHRAWSNSRLKTEHGNAVLWNDMLIGSDGGEPGFLVALDSTSGELLWKKRLPKANLLVVEEQMVLILDADGTLHLARPTKRGPVITSQIDVLDELSWSAPTLVGRTLYLRDPSTLVALRLP